MPNISVQLRRGTDTEHSSFTGAEGEVTVDTTNDTLRVHDGSTAGGIRLAKLSEAGGSGTVTSVDSGTGLTGGPITTSGTLSIADNGVTFAKMQDINTAKVIGRTTAGSGNPEEVSILDEDAMTSDSATALATQQSIKAYVDASGSVTAPTGNTVATSGTSTLAGGLIIKFGQGSSSSDSEETFSFPTSFPNNHFSTVINRTDADSTVSLHPNSISTSGFTIDREAGIQGNVAFNFISIGN